MRAQAAAVLVAFGLAAPAAPADRQELLRIAREVMQKARYATLVTVGADGHPQARVVDPLAPEADMSVWIATRPATRKVAEIKADPRVTLLYFDAAGPSFVTLLARAELVSDPAHKAAHWKDAWAPFYANSHRGDDFVLIRAVPLRLELVSPPHGVDNDPVSWRPTTIRFP
jgi:general stress protein 26